MKSNKIYKLLYLGVLFLTVIISSVSFAYFKTKAIHPIVVHSFYEKAKNNTNWKHAFTTGKHGQIVFMNVSPNTNPKNEIGMETHTFDQIILIADGEGKAVLNGKTSKLEPGDMIFIPQGTSHNVINVNKDKPLKIISFYSDTDIPADSVYKTKADEH